MSRAARDTYLVTGSRGFLAGALAAELRRRHPRSRLVLVDHKPQRGHLAWDLGDAREASRLIRRFRPKVVFHLAGCKPSSGRRALWAAHVRTTRNLLEAVRSLPVPGGTAVLVAGSSAEYGRPPAGVLRESAPARPVSPYGASKLRQTETALAYGRRGLKVFVARIFNVMGPGMPPHLSLGSFASQIARIERGRQEPVLRTGSLSARRDYIDARDLARALVDIVKKGRSGEVYNVCSGRARPMSALLSALASFSTRDVRISSDAARGAAGVPRVVGSRRKLTARTGWRPRVPLERSLLDTLEWHRALIRREKC